MIEKEIKSDTGNYIHASYIHKSGDTGSYYFIYVFLIVALTLLGLACFTNVFSVDPQQQEQIFKQGENKV